MTTVRKELRAHVARILFWWYVAYISLCSLAHRIPLKCVWECLRGLTVCLHHVRVCVSVLTCFFVILPPEVYREAISPISYNIYIYVVFCTAGWPLWQLQFRSFGWFQGREASGGFGQEDRPGNHANEQISPGKLEKGMISTVRHQLGMGIGPLDLVFVVVRGRIINSRTQATDRAQIQNPLKTKGSQLVGSPLNNHWHR